MAGDGVLAYLFWHQPAPDIEPATYAEAQRAFHTQIGVPSACFRLESLPFREEPGYEDWYLVDDWAKLGELSAAAVDSRRRPSHDRAAAKAGAGWAGVYRLLRGEAEIPEGGRWLDKPRGEATADFLASLDAPTIWRRELVLGPAPEFRLGSSSSVVPYARIA